MKNPRTLYAVASTALLACAAGPRPVPASATPEERLAHCEAALLSASSHTAKVLIDSKGADALTGTLSLQPGGLLALSVEGTLGVERVSVELIAKDDVINRVATKGAAVSSHQEPRPEKLRDVVGRGTVRLGLRALVARLADDKPLELTDQGLEKTVHLSTPTSLGAEQVGGIPCTRVSASVERDGQPLEPFTLCIDDSTGLPLERREGVAENVRVERYQWQAQASK